MTVTVKGGQTASVVYVADGKPATNTSFERANTIEDLFLVIQQAIDNKVDRLSVDYDATYDYPRTINIDQHINAADDEMAYFVSDLRVGP